MLDDDDDDEHGTYGMIMGFTLFAVVGILLLVTSMPRNAPPGPEFSASVYDTRFR